MVKLAAFPKCWVEDISLGKMKLSEWIELSTQLNCDGLEFYSHFLTSDDSSYLAGIRRSVESRGMCIPMLCHSPDFTNPDNAARKREIEKQLNAIRITAELGGRFTRVLSGQKYPGLDRDETVRRVVDSIESCLPEAERCGIVLVMENHYKDGFWKYPEFAQPIALFTEIINQIDSKHFGVQYDPSNTIVANENPLEMLDLVAPRVKTMHASDRYIQDGFDPVEVLAFAGEQGYHPALLHGVVGSGLNDYPSIFSKLRAVNFDGWISIEDGMNGMGEMKDSAAYLRAMIFEYFG
jgi:sugar phosphate isomerase/epimerase